MCTLTFIKTNRGVRLVHSRDEQRTRAEGVPPTIWHAGGATLLSPRDPDAGGTWIAARDDGVLLAVMNRNPEPAPEFDRSGLRSRGHLIELLAQLHPTELAEGLRSINARSYAPFRAFSVAPAQNNDGAELWMAEWTAPSPGSGTEAGQQREAESVSPTVTQIQFPACWASSGLGDSVVADRVPLFEALVSPDPSIANQDLYHNHAWPDRGEASVYMSRRDARTVSITAVETHGRGPATAGNPRESRLAATMTYWPVSAGATVEAPMTREKPHIAVLEQRKLAARD